MLSRGFAFSTVPVLFLALSVASVDRVASAQTSASVAPSPEPSAARSAAPTKVPERFSFHAQSTDVQQYHGPFPAAYNGPQSTSNADTAQTIDATLYLGARVVKHTELYINPELDQGFGLANSPAAAGFPYNGTFGAGGFPSAEAYKVGRDGSYGRIHRAFIPQTFDFGGGIVRRRADFRSVL